jgi:hypothetical protein
LLCYCCYLLLWQRVGVLLWWVMLVPLLPMKLRWSRGDLLLLLLLLLMMMMMIPCWRLLLVLLRILRRLAMKDVTAPAVLSLARLYAPLLRMTGWPLPLMMAPS